jgi:hypothetical protein
MANAFDPPKPKAGPSTMWSRMGKGRAAGLVRRLTKVSDGAQAAASDTRLRSPMAGGAARGIARRLRRHGCQLVGDPEGFIVDDSHGPLRVGEIERAKHWGAQLVRADIRTAH